MNNEVLESKRLICKSLNLNHLSLEYVNWLNDVEVIKHLESGGDYTYEKLKAFLTDVENKDILFWAVHLKENGKHIGNIKIDPINEAEKSGEYGIMFGDKTEWNKGYARECSELVINYCFSTLGLQKITLGVKEENKAAINLYKKIGFFEYEVIENSKSIRMMILKNKNKICLGTVQFGLNYGISNTHGVPSDEELKSIFSVCKETEINQLDTAQAYGNAEERIGLITEDNFEIITKFPNVSTTDELEEALSQSLKHLKKDSIYGYLAHNANILIEKPFLWETLQKAKSEKKIKKTGYSLYHPEQLEQLLALNCIPDLVQLPFSILDRKFEKSLAILKQLGTEIHVRSVFLQGLYFLNPKELPEKLQPLQSALIELQEICKENKVNVASAALNYVISNPNIDKVVLGVETANQLKENVQLISSWKLSSSLFSKIEAIKIKDQSLLNPVNW